MRALGVASHDVSGRAIILDVQLFTAIIVAATQHQDGSM